MTNTQELSDDLVLDFHESYGFLPKHLLRMVKRFNVSPSDWDMLTDTFGEDWNGIRNCILENIMPGTRSFNVFGIHDSKFM